MNATIHIGDNVLTVHENRRHPEDESHTIISADAYTMNAAGAGMPREQLIAFAEVPDEPAAIAVVQDFLNLDGPADQGAFRKLFPEMCP